MKLIANLYYRLLYRLWSGRLSVLLLGKALEAQYPSLMVQVQGNADKHHLVALTKNSLLFILKTHQLARHSRKELIPLTFAEYLDLQARLKAWQTSEPYAKIQQGIQRIGALALKDAPGKIRLSFPGDAGTYVTTAAYLHKQAFMRNLMSCTHALWLVVYEDMVAAKAYLPHEVKVLALEAV